MSQGTLFATIHNPNHVFSESNQGGFFTEVFCILAVNIHEINK
jgi:hypothetical protein